MTVTHTVSAKRLVVQFISFWLLWFIVQIGLNQPIQRHFAGWSQEILLDLIKLIVWLGAALVVLTSNARSTIDRP